MSHTQYQRRDHPAIWRMYFEERLTQTEIARRVSMQQAEVSRIVGLSPERCGERAVRRYNKGHARWKKEASS